jgi:hypothetical protein
MMRFELGLEEPDPKRARRSAWTIALHRQSHRPVIAALLRLGRRFDLLLREAFNEVNPAAKKD